MPKIFLIKNRLHQQQQRLLESQNLLQHKNDDDRLVPPLSPTPHQRHHHQHELHHQQHHQQQQQLSPIPSPSPSPPRQPQTPEPQDLKQLRQSPTTSTTTNLASTSDSLKALHIHHQSNSRSRSQSPVEVLNLQKNNSELRARAKSPVDEDDEEQPLSLVSSLTYLGRKRFYQYHQLQQNRLLKKLEHNEEKNNDDVEKEEKEEVGPASISEDNDRLSPCTTTPLPLNCSRSPASSATSSSLSPASFEPTTTPALSSLQDCKVSAKETFCNFTQPKSAATTAAADKVLLPPTPSSTSSSSSSSSSSSLEETPKSASPKHRYISSYLGAITPQTSKSVTLTLAQRKEYPVEIIQQIQEQQKDFKQSLLSFPEQEDSDTDTDSDDGSKLIVDEKPLIPEDQPLSLRVRCTPPPEEQRPSPPPCPEPAVRCSVIQRTPSSESENQRHPHEVLLPVGNLEHLGPEQQEPIDYHVPRRKSSFDNDEEQLLNAKRLDRERKLREARRRSALIAARTILAQARINPRFVRSLPGILAAAAGHGRTTSGSGGNNQGQSFQGSFGGNSGSGSQQNSSGGGSPTGFSGSGGLSGGSGGGMGGGRDGRGNYGPNSPPSGALPPFYESLKSNNAMNTSSSNNFSGSPNSTATSNFLLQNAAAYLMSAAGSGGGSTGQQFPSAGGDNLGGLSSSLDHSTSSASSMLFQNGHGNNSLPYNSLAHCAKYNQPSSPSSASSPQHFPNTTSGNSSHLPYGPNPSAYGIILKDEPDIEYDESKIDIGAFAQNIIQATMGNSGNFNASAYEDAIMNDLASAAQGANGSVDPLQFTATLMLSSQTDHLLEQLSDAVDLSSFLQRNCVDDEDSTSPRQDFELVSTPSLTPDSVSITPVDCHNASSSNLDSFHENLMQQLTNNITRSQIPYHTNNNNYERQQQNSMQQQQQQNPPPSYQHATRDIMQMQQQNYHQNSQQQQQQQSPLNSLINQNSLLMQQQQQQQQNYHQHSQYQHLQQHHQQHSSSNLNHHQLQHHNHHHQQQQQQLQHQQQQHHHHQHHHHHHMHHSSQHHHQSQHHQHHQHHSDNSNLSLPSPNATSSSTTTTTTTANGHLLIQSQGHHPMSSAASNTSSGSASALLDTSLLDTKPIIQSLGLPPEVQLEFVNGGHGIKNPLAIENTHGHHHHHHRIRSIDCIDDLKKPLMTEPTNTNSACTTPNNDQSDPNGKFICRICLKGFSLQRLLNRHMKCHSEIKRYLCTFCGKGFNDTFDLKRHTRTHTGVRPYKCNLCEKSFTQRCSLESHCLKVHSVQHQYAYKERRTKMYVCEECGHTTCEPEVHYLHLKENHPYSPALLKFYDKRHFKFTNSQFANNLLGQLPMPVHN